MLKRFRLWLGLFALIGLTLVVWQGCGGSGDDDDDVVVLEDDDTGTPTPAPTGGDDDASVGDDDASVGDDDDAVLPTREPAPTLPPFEFEQANWYSENFNAITEFVTQHGGATNPLEAPVAVFEFERTAAYGAIGVATFRYQVHKLVIQVEPGLMEELVPLSAGADWDAPAVVETLTEEYGGLAIADLRSDILKDYNVLYYVLEPLGCVPPDTGDEEGAKRAAEDNPCLPFEEIQQMNEYKDFVAKLLFLYEGLTAHPDVGPDYTAPMIARFLGNFPASAIEGIARNAFEGERAAEVGYVSFTSPEMADRVVSPVTVRYLEGMREIGELEDLMDYLRSEDFEVWVVSYASQLVVSAVTASLESNYGVPANRVIGIELEMGRGANPILTTEIKKGEPIPYGEGKITAIEDKIGRSPMFVVGSTAADYEMLTRYATQALQLVINHNESCPIQGLYATVVSGDTSRGDYLLQGADDNAGQLLPSQETIPFGETTPTSVSPDANCI